MKGLDKVRDGGDVESVLEEVVASRRAGTDPKELFGGPRDWIDSGLPPLAFFVGNLASGIRAGVWAAAVVLAVEVVIRLVSRETLRHAFSGVFGVAIAALIAVKTHRASNFFLPGIVINGVYALLFLASIAFGYPLVGVIMRLVYDKKPRAWHDHPLVRRAYVEATLLWAGMFAVRAVVMEYLRRRDELGFLVAAKIAMGYPLYIAALALTLPYIKRRTVGVPEMALEAGEAEAEGGGEDAGEEAS